MYTVRITARSNRALYGAVVHLFDAVYKRNNELTHREEFEQNILCYFTVIYGDISELNTVGRRIAILTCLKPHTFDLVTL